MAGGVPCECSYYCYVVLAEILSDRVKAFLSDLFKEAERLLGFHKVNTTAYHPQTDGLVKRFNRTLIAMLAKTTEKGGQDWDRRLPYVLFANRAAEQQSTLELPFFLLYGCDPRLLTEAALYPEERKKLTDLREYGSELAKQMSEAWELARDQVKCAQKRQKMCYDQKAKPPQFLMGNRVLLYKPAEKTGEGRKLARPYHGPYRIIELAVNNAQIRKLDKHMTSLFKPIALDRLRRYPTEVPNVFWPPKNQQRKRPSKSIAVDHEQKKATAPSEKTIRENQLKML